MNLGRAPFNSREIRQAIAPALNPDAMLETIMLNAGPMSASSATTLLLTCGTQEPPLLSYPLSAGRVAALDQYALDQTALEAYKALLISMHSDQRHLVRRQPQLEGFLRGGGIIVFSGHIAYPFLSELRRFVAIDYRVEGRSERTQCPRAP